MPVPLCVYVYWDNSNIFLGARDVAEHLEHDVPNIRMRVRVDFRKLLLLAHDERPLKRTVAAGSIPPAMEELWHRLANDGKVHVDLFNRHGYDEQGVPDTVLQWEILLNAINIKPPGVMVLLTGDGAGYQGKGFLKVLKSVHHLGWKVELLAWRWSCNEGMLQWVQENGLFVPLDEFYASITFLEGSPSRDSEELDLAKKGLMTRKTPDWAAIRDCRQRQK